MWVVAAYKQGAIALPVQNSCSIWSEKALSAIGVGRSGVMARKFDEIGREIFDFGM
jgi:D-arabinose 5-phosphate isomerase GutQ